MGSCEALARAERAAAHPATSWQSVGEAEAAGGHPSALATCRRGDVCCEDYMNLFRRYCIMKAGCAKKGPELEAWTWLHRAYSLRGPLCAGEAFSVLLFGVLFCGCAAIKLLAYGQAVGESWIKNKRLHIDTTGVRKRYLNVAAYAYRQPDE